MPKRRRRTFTPQFKARIVLEVLSGQRSASESARPHERKPELISRRKDIALEGLEGRPTGLAAASTTRPHRPPMGSGFGVRWGGWPLGGRLTATAG